MLAFLDTEFTSFDQCELISIGLVTENGDQFYAECSDFNRSLCSPFVIETVFPLLNKQPDRVFTTTSVRNELTKWLFQFDEEPGGVSICIDYLGDWSLFSALLENDVPSWIHAKNIWPYIDHDVQKQYFIDTGLAVHHALNDANANKFAYRPSS